MKRSDPGDAPSVRPRSDVRVAGRRCPACDVDVDAAAADSVACATCLARHHEPCWRERGCSACGSGRLLARVDPARRRGRLALLSSIAVLAVLAVAVAVASLRAPEVTTGHLSAPPSRTAEAVTALAHARLLMDVADDEGALRRLDQAIAASPGYAGAYYFRGLAHASLNDLPRAAADYTRALELAPQCAPGHPSSVCDVHHPDTIYLVRGVVRLRLGDAPGAIDDFDRALELQPAALGELTHHQRGLAFMSLGDRSQAALDFERVLERLPPGDPLVDVLRQHLAEARDATPAPPQSGTASDCLARSKARLHRLGDPHGSLDDLTRAVELDPSCAEAFDLRAQARAAIGDLAGAVDDLDRALALTPDLGHLVVRRAALESRLGRHEVAYEHLVAATRGPTVSRDLRYLRGVAALRVGKAREAVRDFEALVAGSDRLRGSQYLAEAPTLYQGLLEEARRALGR